MNKLGDVNPLIRATSGVQMPRGDEVHTPLMANPYPTGSQEASEYENGYEFVQDYGHMALGQATPNEIQRWRNNPIAWRQGFAKAASSMGLNIIGDQLLQTQKTSALVPLPHQTRVSDKLHTSDGQVVVHGLGSGKTFTGVNAAAQHGLPLLSIVPAALRNNMRKEISAAGFPNEARVVSYQQALNQKDDPEFRDFASRALVVSDEAHRMGQVTSDRSQLTHALPAKKKLLMTATPIRNSPEEIAPLVNAVSPGSLPESPEEFRKKFIGTREVPVGFWGRLRGLKAGEESVPINLHEFQKAVKGKVDFYESADRSDYPSFDEKIVEVPMSQKQEAAYNFVMGRYPTFAYRVRHGLPLNRRPDSDFQAFMIGPRQVANHPGGFNASATDADAPKIHTMADEIEKRYKQDKNFRGVSYSSFIDSGINPLARELQRRKIPFATFTGDIDDKERAETVKNYNTGKVPLLLISGAGAEGLDLKGTKLMQIMEPHWQDTQIDQVKGRAVRYKSHSHLPEHERHVEVQRFHTIPRASFWDRLLGRKRSGDQSADEYIYQMAKKKESLNNAFLEAARQGEQSQKAAEFHEVRPVDDAAFPGLLVDLDQTLVDHPNGFSNDLGSQVALPHRHEILKRFKDAGYKVVGVTNRALYNHESGSVDDIRAKNHETMRMFDGLLDDIIYCPVECEHQKPAPTMLLHAMTLHGIDPENSIFVGDSKDDELAAASANLPYYHPNEFFRDPRAFDQLPRSAPVKKADWTDPRNRDVHVQKHAPEFGSPEEYLALERQISAKPPEDMRLVNERCVTTYDPQGNARVRCSRGYFSPSTGLLHVREKNTGRTVSLYRKVPNGPRP